MAESSRQQAPLTWGRRLGYSMGDYGFNLYWQSISLFLYFFYTDVLGISPLWAGISFAIASVYDAVSDPIMGSIADRTRTRWGRYRPYLAIGAIPCAVSFGAMFYIPPASGVALIVYATLSHVLFRTFFTLASIPYLAMSANLSSDSGERANLAGMRMMFAASGGLTIAFFLPKLVSSLTGKVAQPYFVVSILIGAIVALILFICFFSTRENDFADEAQDEPMTVRLIMREVGRDVFTFWGMLRLNGPLARVFGAIVVIAVALSMFSKCVLYWFKYGLERPDMTPVALVIPALMLLVFAPFWVWFAKRFSKRNAWLLGSVFTSTGYLGFYLNQSTSMTLVLGWIFIIGLGTSAYAVGYWAMLPDTVEYNEWKLGVRNEGKVVGFAAFAQKSALAINAVLLGQLLEMFGYVANQPLSIDTLTGIKVIMCLIPLAGVVLSVAILWRYPITPAFHRKMLDELEVRDRARHTAAAS